MKDGIDPVFSAREFPCASVRTQAKSLASLDGAAHSLFDRAEAAMRKAILDLPDGTYRYAMTTDGLDAPL